MPVVHWFGYADLRKNPPLLDRLIRVLGEEVEERFGVDDLCMFVPLRSQGFPHKEPAQREDRVSS